jgi:hypothetical protein
LKSSLILVNLLKSSLILVNLFLKTLFPESHISNVFSPARQVSTLAFNL